MAKKSVSDKERLNRLLIVCRSFQHRRGSGVIPLSLLKYALVLLLQQRKTKLACRLVRDSSYFLEESAADLGLSACSHKTLPPMDMDMLRLLFRLFYDDPVRCYIWFRHWQRDDQLARVKPHTRFSSKWIEPTFDDSSACRSLCDMREELHIILGRSMLRVHLQGAQYFRSSRQWRQLPREVKNMQDVVHRSSSQSTNRYEDAVSVLQRFLSLTQGRSRTPLRLGKIAYVEHTRDSSARTGLYAENRYPGLARFKNTVLKKRTVPVHSGLCTKISEIRVDESDFRNEFAPADRDMISLLRCAYQEGYFNEALDILNELM